MPLGTMVPEQRPGQVEVGPSVQLPATQGPCPTLLQRAFGRPEGAPAWTPRRWAPEQPGMCPARSPGDTQHLPAGSSPGRMVWVG